jgi:2,4-dienoyl-CoA reductase-like NADH-dependent reductase (Old Yellow Enzyme family)
MCQYSSTDGFVNDWHVVHLGSRAVGGAGLVFFEATGVSPEGRISPKDLGIWEDEHIAGLKRIVDFIHAQGTVAGIQLAHAGRKASHDVPWKGGKFLSAAEGGWQIVGPSALPFSQGTDAPLQLDEEGIQKIITDFRRAAVRALDAGFKIIEIHAAHGYLLHQFLSPLSNQRTDEYGGSFENRIRLITQVVDVVRQVLPEDFPLFIRVSATDWTEGGWTLEDTVQLASVLKEKGVDLFDCSSGGVVPHAKIPVGPGYQVPFAESVRKQTGLLTGAVGMIEEAKQAEAILQNDQADLILIARKILRDPYFSLHAAIELGDDIAWPDQYARAKPRL